MPHRNSLSTSSDHSHEHLSSNPYQVDFQGHDGDPYALQQYRMRGSRSRGHDDPQSPPRDTSPHYYHANGYEDHYTQTHNHQANTGSPHWAVPVPGPYADAPHHHPGLYAQRRGSIADSEASTVASCDYAVTDIGFPVAEELNRPVHIPAVNFQDSAFDNFGPTAFLDIIPGPSSQIVSTHNRIVRESMYKDRQAHIASMSIIESMAKIRLRVSHGGIVEQVNPVDRNNVLAEIEAFTATTTPELQSWIYAGSQRKVGTIANARISVSRRTNRNGSQLFCCAWCSLVTTTKNNLGSK
ncbi:hypothetical protein CVT24_012861 [Panaeolus cyanescens]|uniref:Uncharacterized protein n=1 Tax=Panaeolus cyanescens TaxID=181874 RepID=A0A409W6L4_9AGAR|nr:hypothetical protein CVT24_012861 [Panaeolus cyanescens]